MSPIGQYIQYLAALRELTVEGHGRSRRARELLVLAEAALAAHPEAIIAHIETNAGRPRAAMTAAEIAQYSHEARIALRWLRRCNPLDRARLRRISAASGLLNHGDHPALGGGYNGIRVHPTRASKRA